MAEKYSLFLLSLQLSTDTKSATKLGISHLTKAEFPNITYSLSAFVSYGCVTTRNKISNLIEICDFAYQTIIFFQATKIGLQVKLTVQDVSLFTDCFTACAMTTLLKP